MDELQQRELACGLRAGSAAAWHALHDAYAERVWRCVARLVGPLSADVADVVQETFLAAARSAHTYDPVRGPLWLWLWGIARRQVALHFRRECRHARVLKAVEQVGPCRDQLLRWLDGREASPPDVLATAELAAVVRVTLTELPDEYEALLTAFYLDGVPVADLSAQGFGSAEAVRSKLARARRAFRAAFGRFTDFFAPATQARHDLDARRPG
jgi:RNA polymerase sigma-70 factor (ECF subfamily)